MKVKLTYFRPGGKYYGEGTYETQKEHLFEIWDEVQAMAASAALPGVSSGHWTILVDVPDHVNNHPHLIVSRDLEVIARNLIQRRDERVIIIHDGDVVGGMDAIVVGDDSLRLPNGRERTITIAWRRPDENYNSKTKIRIRVDGRGVNGAVQSVERS